MNYFQYGSLEEADENNPIFIIPVEFTMSDETYTPRVISTGTDANEVHEDSQSATQYPRTYVFPCNGGIIRLIDTPGIGDTRGPDKDRENYQRILNHIASLDMLHGICILLQPSNARLSVMMDYCLKGLFANLHRDACRVICFCFTSCRSTNYMIGDTVTPLSVLLKEQKMEGCLIDKKTIYCFDNEAVRFLAAVKQEMNLGEMERIASSESWNRATTEYERLLKHFCSVKPHLVKNTLSVNDARYTILSLTKPLANICMTVEKTRRGIEVQKRNLADRKAAKDEHEKHMYMPQFKMKTVPLRRPRLVCTSEKCREYTTDISNMNTTVYRCSTEAEKTNTLRSILETSKRCDRCGCKADEHEVQTYEVEIFECKKINKAVQRCVTSEEVEIKLNENHLQKLEALGAELDAEHRQIFEASRKFARFLKLNAIAPYNSTLKRYLAYIISTNAGTKRAEDLESVGDRCDEEANTLEELIAGTEDDGDVTPREVGLLIKGLYSLRQVGNMIRGSATVAESVDLNVTKANEIVFFLKSREFLSELFKAMLCENTLCTTTL